MEISSCARNANSVDSWKRLAGKTLVSFAGKITGLNWIRKNWMKQKS
jgi:hypothetical protein